MTGAKLSAGRIDATLNDKDSVESYIAEHPDAKVKVVVYDRSGRKFTCSKITTAADYEGFAKRPRYPVLPAWEE